MKEKIKIAKKNEWKKYGFFGISKRLKNYDENRGTMKQGVNIIKDIIILKKSILILEDSFYIDVSLLFIYDN